ncbi:hypothetical protein AUEXF2481DRAFT_25775 [Aureobasidium subglaciale EXF-2481]|uniref:BTB domain-containing protein n=1 Tax=Aureobasidium subglaciale (strain EXF-2481) TaxID=1043005 RepID=A0A074Z0J9_AURSE|nr:uncharacterized protein AUEXF2481DRAFT_25775 [Aureobasidium subglaciale EXF-2481]KAI5211419.1 hypothetical protein E4T38_01420 [Aureobasidium subglaciale]KAI5229750.1 hypothetical protein E4T40_01421 [Aureobasidium subglaciale]KAI5233361.1 hypothetical protein E4T41_01418 [Aureobasidium subglaciale]KAI5266691.1 hypothetical protein E4T46_01420 [Aureobasidium subglaciale]KEQ99902.1 hypothetical protein AUEXF2481DRAFT_25775 [Aureobasidium subglaciale EXF-2481]
MTSEACPEQKFASVIAGLHKNGAYSDLKIVCGSTTYNVHKAIVCPQSDFFRVACRPDTFREGRTGIINIPATVGRDKTHYEKPIAAEEFDWDLDVETRIAIKLMIHYFYHHDYLQEETAESQPPDGYRLTPENFGQGILAEHARMYAMGEKYGIPGLKVLAAAKYKALGVRTLAGLAAAIMITFKGTVSTDKVLRTMVSYHIDILRYTHRNVPELRRTISEIPELAFELYQRALERERACEPVRVTKSHPFGRRTHSYNDQL